VRQWLNAIYWGRRIGNRGPIAWTPRQPHNKAGVSLAGYFTEHTHVVLPRATIQSLTGLKWMSWKGFGNLWQRLVPKSQACLKIPYDEASIKLRGTRYLISQLLASSIWRYFEFRKLNVTGDKFYNMKVLCTIVLRCINLVTATYGHPQYRPWGWGLRWSPKRCNLTGTWGGWYPEKIWHVCS
jgi:hypothetical protein